MRKKVYISIVLCIILLLSSCSLIKGNASAINKGNKLTNKQWIEDIDYLETNLEQKHCDVYHSISKNEYENEFNALKNDVPNLNDDEIELRLSQIVASIGDSHTSLLLEENANTKLYPIGVDWFGNDLKVFAIEKSYIKVIGSNLTAINGIPIKKVLSNIDTLISHDNDQWLKYNEVNYVNRPEVLKFFDITKTDKAEFTFCDNEGKTTKINLTPEVITSKNLININDLIKNKPVAKQHDSSNYHDNSNYYDSLYWYKYIPEDKIMYFQYNQCEDRNTAKMAGYKDFDKYPDFNEFSNKLLKELNDNDVDKLIIDLRYNTGGNSTLMSNFVNSLSKIKKLNAKGKIYVLIGKETYSSGVLACVSLKKFTNAIFVGEPTGGNVNLYGDIKTLTLPNSKIQVTYSTRYFEFLPKYKENFIPDIFVEESFKDYAKGIDDVYEAAKDNKAN